MFLLSLSNAPKEIKSSKALLKLSKGGLSIKLISLKLLYPIENNCKQIFLKFILNISGSFCSKKLLYSS